MNWSEQQRARLADEYARIGYVPGESWPAPPPGLTPDDLLDLLSRVADGGGRQGYMVALARYESGERASEHRRPNER